jgi:hypothetical protein
VTSAHALVDKLARVEPRFRGWKRGGKIARMVHQNARPSLGQVYGLWHIGDGSSLRGLLSLRSQQATIWLFEDSSPDAGAFLASS